MQNDNVTQVLALLIRELDIPVTSQSIEEETAKHPNYTSLLAISEVLNTWHIPNGAYELTFEELQELPAPFIAFIYNKYFVLVKHLDGEKVIISKQAGENKTITIDEFRRVYSGSVLIAEKDEGSGEVGYQRKRRKELLNEWRIPSVIASSAILMLIFLSSHPAFINSVNIPVALLALFKTAGLITTVLLLIQSIDSNNPLVQKLCNGNNNKDCNAILSSKAAKVFEELSWSEVGFFYFGGTWLVLLLGNGHLGIMQVLGVLNIVSLPYTMYSIYYQWRVARQWCVFCCTVQALLWLEFFAIVPELLHGFQFPDVADWGTIVIGMALPVLAWVFIKPYLLQQKQLDSLKIQVRKFKYNAKLFHKLLKDQEQFILPDDSASLIIGNVEAGNVITMVSNPFCQPCAKAHQKLDEWLDGRDDIKLQVIFSTHNSDDQKAEVAKHLMTMQATENNQKVKEALNDWYAQKQKSYEAWAKTHPVTTQADHTGALDVQREWNKMAKITGTPTLFINGRRLPQNYQPEDLKYFI